ncbi:hypothetical protein PVAND_014394 [Polypedilum vanderplanki]|uniref:Dihydroorotate dehydrogenase (quinone), mitochondrial n=1 Tax=Polypedilum vanderplanki TaxID=319348 RepID=A0A9J6BA22_POLVA|nr:hypothetical protein PVAND_014394 [Polypedilum vanderplanki]
MSSSKFFRRLRSLIVISTAATGITFGFSYYRNDEQFFKTIFMPTVRLLEAERAHELAVFICKWNFLPSVNYKDPASLSTEICNIALKNPVGIAAGFDKNAEAIEGLDHLGFGFIEVGSVTPLAQVGNQKPRVFRLTEDEAIINRYGFNSDGHEKVWHRIQQLRASGKFNGVLGVNLGKNKMSEDAVNDYLEGLKLFSPVADYLVINVSSPNTPGLRDLQQKDSLKTLLCKINETKKQIETPKPIFVKLAPDLTQSELKDICNTIQRKDCHVDGLIISNTTIDRSVALNSSNAFEVGGLSGKPLKEKSRRMIEDVYKMTNGKIPIIGVGGIGSGQDAYEKIIAGASAIQLYSSFVFHGPPLVTKVKKELDDILKSNGYQNVQQAVGKGVQMDKKSFLSYFF